MVLKRQDGLIFIPFQDEWEKSLVLAMLKKLKVDYRIEDKQKRVITPRFVYTIFLVKALPIKIFDWILNFFGINHSMDESLKLLLKRYCKNTTHFYT